MLTQERVSDLLGWPVDAEVYTLSQLLTSPGGALFFTVPEPERALALAMGVAVLGWLARSRRSGSHHAAR